MNNHGKEMIKVVSGDVNQSRYASSRNSISMATSISPQEYLDALLNSRGYTTKTRRTLETGYRSSPTRLQKASFGLHIVNLARNGKKKELQSAMECGISSNPCSMHGESLLHIVCRRCDHLMLKILLDAGASLQFSCDQGRTPLHDACWRALPCFEIIEMIGNEDLNLFHLAGSRGSLPLSYVHQDHWLQWIDFLHSKKDIWWPSQKHFSKNLESNCPTPSLLDVPPFTHSLPDPQNALSAEMAQLVAMGGLSPKEAVLLNTDKDMDDYGNAHLGDYLDSEDDMSDEDYDSDSEDDFSCDSAYDNWRDSLRNNGNAPDNFKGPSSPSNYCIVLVGIDGDATNQTSPSAA